MSELKKMIEFHSVYAGYNKHSVLEDVNLTIKENDFIGVIGPNGGGKTTFLKLILGLIKPLKGKILFTSSINSRSFGYVPQIQKLDPKFPISVEEVVISGLSSTNPFQSLKKNNKTVDQTLNILKINTLKNRPIGELSGGQRQKALIGRAIVSSPSLLLLDEPDTYVDSEFEGELYELLRELNKKMAVILVSHDLGTISSYVKTIACINRSFHYHMSNKITQEQLNLYNCPIKLITHGDIPHEVLKKHK
ncbi:metal ABC transporter ATP-binding protein [Bacteroidota bacterium]